MGVLYCVRGGAKLQCWTRATFFSSRYRVVRHFFQFAPPRSAPLFSVRATATCATFLIIAPPHHCCILSAKLAPPRHCTTAPPRHIKGKKLSNGAIFLIKFSDLAFLLPYCKCICTCSGWGVAALYMVKQEQIRPYFVALIL